MSEVIKIKGISGGMDRRGKVEANFDFWVLADTIEQALAATFVAPTTLPYIGCAFKEWDIDDQSFVITAKYEGTLPGADNESKDQYEITRERREEPIEAFPKRQQLIDQYGAYVDENGRLIFPEFLPRDIAGKGNGSLLFKTNSVAKKGERNPLFGVATYPLTYAIAVHSFVRSSIPPTWYADEDKIIKALPSGFAPFNYPQGKSWVVDPVIGRKRGNCMEGQRKWRQIDQQKHIEALQLLLSGGK
jgi:hypothetical protein